MLHRIRNCNLSRKLTNMPVVVYTLSVSLPLSFSLSHALSLSPNKGASHSAVGQWEGGAKPRAAGRCRGPSADWLRGRGTRGRPAWGRTPVRRPGAGSCSAVPPWWWRGRRWAVASPQGHCLQEEAKVWVTRARIGRPAGHHCGAVVTHSLKMISRC